MFTAILIENHALFLGLRLGFGLWLVAYNAFPVITIVNTCNKDNVKWGYQKVHLHAFQEET